MDEAKLLPPFKKKKYTIARLKKKYTIAQPTYIANS
jgi:hypothetical protein